MGFSIVFFAYPYRVVKQLEHKKKESTVAVNTKALLSFFLKCGVNVSYVCLCVFVRICHCWLNQPFHFKNKNKHMFSFCIAYVVILLVPTRFGNFLKEEKKFNFLCVLPAHNYMYNYRALRRRLYSKIFAPNFFCCSKRV